MSYRVEISPEAQKEIRALPGKVAHRLQGRGRPETYSRFACETEGTYRLRESVVLRPVIKLCQKVKKQVTSISQARTLEEIAEFWDTCMMRDDTVYLHHILDAIKQIEDYLKGVSEGQFLSVFPAATREGGDV